MKEYIKPTTDVQNIEVNAYMQAGSPLEKTNDKVGNQQQMTKERDVWSDGFWD